MVKKCDFITPAISEHAVFAVYYSFRTWVGWRKEEYANIIVLEEQEGSRFPSNEISNV